MNRVCLFCGSNAGTRPAYAQAAADFGRALAARGMTLVYGGGSVGLMKIAAEAALAANGSVIGVITEQLMVREVGHPGLSELTVVPTMHERKSRMAALADRAVWLKLGQLYWSGSADALPPVYRSAAAPSAAILGPLPAGTP